MAVDPRSSNERLEGDLAHVVLNLKETAQGRQAFTRCDQRQASALLHILESVPVETSGDTVPRSRYDACNRDWLEAKAKYDGAAAVIGELAALIPLSETIAATRTIATMVQWFKEHLRPAVETAACKTCGDDICSGYHAELRPEKASPPLTIDATAATGQGNTAFGLPVKATEPHKCERCGHINRIGGGTVCYVCGGPLPEKTSEAWVCPKCQQLNSAGTTTCGRCEDL